MQIFRYFTSSLSLGLDIGSTEIRLLALRRKKRHIYIEKMTTQPLPLGAVIEGKIQQPDIVAAHLRILVQKAHVYNEKVTIALPFQSVISKKIPLEEATAVHHIHDYFPGVSDVLAYDYIKIDKEILLIATRQDELMRYVTLVESGGLKVAVVDVDLYALARAAHFVLAPKITSYPIFLLELNSAGSQLILLNQNNILYQQAVPGMIDQIETQLKVVWETYFSNTEIKKIYLLGDFSQTIELVESMSSELVVEIIDISQHYEFKGAISNNFFVCCGLALRGIRAC